MVQADVTALAESLAGSTAFYAVQTDLEGRYTYANPYFLARFKHLAPDLIGTPFQQTLHPDDIRSCQVAAYACIMQPGERVQVVLRKPDNKGAYYWTQWEFCARLEGGVPAGLTCIGFDVTHPRLLSKRLVDLVRRTEVLMNEITECFCMLARDWTLMQVNLAFEAAVQRPAAELIGMAFQELFPVRANCRYPAMFRQVMETDTPIQFEEYYRRRRQWYQIKVYPLEGGLALFAQNITDRKHAYDRIVAQNETLREIARVQSHELRKHLSNVIGLLDHVVPDELPETHRHWFGLLRAAAGETDQVIHRIVRETEKYDSGGPN
ncbi:MAG: PAS domain-containing protein [Bacteroidia bacterium]|nr:PAS domain-containing protein [Bacteroidia bacterium]